MSEWYGDSLDTMVEDASVAARESRRTFWVYDTLDDDRVVAVVVPPGDREGKRETR